MYVVYYGTGDTLAASFAATLHADELPNDCVSSTCVSPYLSRLFHLEKASLGRLLFIGRDEEDHQIFVLNTGYAESIVVPSLLSVFDILQTPAEQVLLVDVTSNQGFLMKWGFFLYGFSITKPLGQRFLLEGIEQNHRQLQTKIEHTKRKLKEKGG